MSSNQGAVTPASTLFGAIQLCRRPFTAAAVRWKVQVNPKDDQPDDRKNATVVAFIDARLAGERLNASGLTWKNEFKPVPGGLLCEISAFDGGEWVSRSDVGWSRGVDGDMPLKTLYSDAFKRAAVKWGVGVSIYALPLKRLYLKDGHIKKLGKTWVITTDGQKALDSHYKKWLEKIGTPQFGEPLDHGDVEDAQGDIESADTQSREELVKDESKAKPEPKPEPTEQAPAEGDKGNSGAAKAKDEESKPADRPISAAGASALLVAYIGGSKNIEEVKNFLTAKGVDPLPDFNEQALEPAFATLSADVGKQLHTWLKRSKQS